MVWSSALSVAASLNGGEPQATAELGDENIYYSEELLCFLQELRKFLISVQR